MLPLIMMHAMAVLIGIALVFPDCIAIKEDFGLIGKKLTSGFKLSLRRKNIVEATNKTLTQIVMNIFFTTISVVLSVNMFLASLAGGFGAGFSISLVGIAITLFFQWLNRWNSYKLFKVWITKKRSEA